jgi:hypothetical protein
VASRISDLLTAVELQRADDPPFQHAVVVAGRTGLAEVTTDTAALALPVLSGG